MYIGLWKDQRIIWNLRVGPIAICKKTEENINVFEYRQGI